MSEITVAFLGDIVGAPGRRVVAQQLPNLRRDRSPDLVIANAENARNGSGLTPDIHRTLKGLGIDAFTLGDHCFRDSRVQSILQSDEPIARPANLADRAVGRRWTRLPIPDVPDRSVFVVTVLGRIFFPLPADDPFATVDAILTELPEPNPIVIVEAHMEATSEKAALAHHLDGRVAAVVGSHTHVPTADARILPGGTAFQTDMGMCGPYDSVIGRDKAQVVRAMSTGMHQPLEVATGGELMCGVTIRIDVDTARARNIERLEYAADRSAAPFR